MKTLFFGTPGVAVPYLEKLAQISQVQRVVTTPDQPAGRGYEVKAPEVKIAAQALGLAIEQPATLKDPAVVQRLQALDFDVAIVVAYGKLLPKPVLALGRHGFLNVHFSLLPKYRGAAPIQWALINGETETGVTLFWLDEGMDTGPVFLQESMGILKEDDAESLRHKLVPLGVRMMEEAIRLLAQGEKRTVPQTGEPSKAPIINKEDGQIDWNKSAGSLVNLLRGLSPWPGVHTWVRHGQKAVRLKLLNVQLVLPSPGSATLSPRERDDIQVIPPPAGEGRPGTIVEVEAGVGPIVRCGEGYLKLVEVQPEGKKRMTGWEFWQGARLNQGDRLG